MTGRKFSAASGYRYGFNGKENDNNISEGGQDYGMRVYDVRVGRFLSVDPLMRQYPELTPYQFASNTPIQAIDLDGLEAIYYTTTNFFTDHFQRLADGSIKKWSTQEEKADMPLKPSPLGHGKWGSGEMWSYYTQFAEVFYDVHGNVESSCYETPILVQKIYILSKADEMKGDISKRPMQEGKYQLLVFGSAGDNSESPGNRANPGAMTEVISMEALDGVIKPIMLGLQTPRDMEAPTITEIASSHFEVAIKKSERIINKPDPNVTFDESCRDNFIKDINGYPTNIRSKNKASDTTVSHGSLPDRKTKPKNE